MMPAMISSSDQPSLDQAVRLRAVLTAVAIIPLNAWWVAMMEAIKYTGHPTTYSLYFNVVIILAALVGVNSLLGRLWRAPYTRTDLLVIYFMLALATALAGHDQAQVLLGVLAYPIYKATPENQWAITFGERIPRYLVPRDLKALDGFFIGHSSFFDHWRAWAVPLGCWAAFVGALLLCFFCLNAVLRRQWVENERLSFPLVALPLQMVEPHLAFFRHRAMWIAFCIPLLINVVNNLHQWFPGVPEVATRRHNLGEYLTMRPWNAIGGTPMFLFPFAVGIGYLLPLDVLGSSWLFFLFWKLQVVTAYGSGLTSGHPNAPFVPEQAFGGYVGLAALSIYAARGHLGRVVRASFGRDPEYARARGEGLPYPLAFWGFWAGFGFLVWFSRRMGMDWWPVVALFAGYFAISLAVDRLRAEFGSPTHDLHNAYVGELLPRAFSPLSFTPQTMTGFALFFWFNRAHRSHLMPVQLESLVAGTRANINLRRLTLAMGVAAVVGIVSAYVAILQPHYQYGADSAKVFPLLRIFGNETWGRLTSQLNSPQRPEPGSLVAVAVGFCACVSLFLIRSQVAGFPLHPVGLAVSSSWSMDQVWLSLVVAWCCKTVLVRYGGLKRFRAGVPFFLGLVLGDFVSGGLFNMVGIWLDLPVYHFLG